MSETRPMPFVAYKNIYDIAGIKVGLWTTIKNHNIHVTFFPKNEANIEKVKALNGSELTKLESKAAKLFIKDRREYICLNAQNS